MPGEQRMQRIAYGRVSVEGESKSAEPAASSEMIGEFALFELQSDLRDELRLPPVPVPVRQSSLGVVFPAGSPVNLAAMLEEVQAFVAASPQVEGAYRALQAGLGSIAGLAAAERGAYEEALQCYEAGLQAAPENIVLRSQEALTLQALGRYAEARGKLEAIVQTVPRGEIMPFVWMLLARRYVEDSEPGKAQPLLDDLSAFGGEDAAVAHFVSAMTGAGSVKAQSAGTEDSAPTAEPAAPARTSKGLVLGLLLAVAVGVGGFAAWRVLGPGGNGGEPGVQEIAPSPPVVAATGPAPASSATPASDAASSAIVRDIPGIWAPEEGGCASGFGFAFTPAGRYAEGDEYYGEEGKWSVVDGHLIAAIELTYAAEDEVSERKVQSASKRYDYLIKDFTTGRMVLANGEAEMAFLRCPEGRRMFVDGETFP